MSGSGMSLIVISTLAPLAGSDEMNNVPFYKIIISTLAPLAGSDVYLQIHRTDGTDFNPRSPRGERRLPMIVWVSRLRYFNPRSPRGERLGMGKKVAEDWAFQPSLPSRGATSRSASLWLGLLLISTLAPLAGSDELVPLVIFFPYYFNPRSPRGERRQA